MPCGVNLSRTYGPVPTGLASPYVAGLLTDCQMCWDTMGWVPIRYMLPACGWAKLSTTVLGPVAVALVGAGVPVWASAGFLASRLKVNATSAALNDWPSLHFTPDLVVRVSVLPPLEKE